ncbi:hypothetical protein LTR64_001716 [Lithohypha guttulata]|uniref:Extracellular mutant protein 11 C-terminal domain-containing protein n=1 Tax=Lithohypha guttulata TaxID=1690604 RepID=A0AAN7Y4Q7_9EURO|nr:hypothetical protein LTR51_003910 [Lithohypha guttulata]KAK5082415.1 hypothetical protein LTR05_007562 [Lithohypha guttulata]
MPMNKDLDAAVQETLPTTPAGFHHARQQSRQVRVSRDNGTDRPTTPGQSKDNRPHRQEHREWSRTNMPNIGKHSLEALGTERLDIQADHNPWKIPVVSSLQPRPENARAQNMTQSVNSSTLKQQKPNMGTKAQKLQQKPPVSAFDDTVSLDSGFIDDSINEDNRTVVFRREAFPPHTTKTGPDHYNSREHDLLSGRLDTQAANEFFGSQWQEELAEERDYQNRLRAQAERQHAVSPFVGKGPTRTAVDHDIQLETPSRAQSVPSVQGIKAPIPRRVDFVSSPEVFERSMDSPIVRSADIAREDSPSIVSSRPNSAQPVIQRVPMHHKPHPSQLATNPQVRQGHSPFHPASGRFHKMLQHSQKIPPQQKVSAPESDMQDSSEDDRLQGQSKQASSSTVLDTTDVFSELSRKRPHASSSADVLDYDPLQLKEKTLSDLQAEPFNTDPKDAAKEPARDTHGNEMTLSQILENLDKMAVPHQQETFRTQTDEQWAQTGQWFVDRFQTDLKELMQVRLQRRTIALAYESKIRQRQMEVEHFRAGVEKELQDLQTGGNGLLKDRRPPGGSRAGTPIRPVKS